ncbi:patatin-like phospholipase family protein [Halarsenatibacter silvermanii]|uniref:patatin-like phospholipase family protein n=1 Tax=Halarsenatibacter silvermanii TaxID=321763 RepID=UPI000B7D16F8|nr:patatin-like phospholipase family protein [Halarsenatibacter silvermanii]
MIDLLGLALEGGGAKGSYHIGVYQALQEQGFEFDGVVGTSIGALNGAMIAQDDFDRALNLWDELDPGELLNIEGEKLEEIYGMEFDRDNVAYLLGRMKEIIKNRGLETEPIKDLIEKNIEEDKLRSRDIDFGLITISLSDMEPRELFLENIPEGKLAEYLLASSYLPAFRLEKLGEEYFLDGGFYDNLPINMLIERGYDKIIAVRTLSRGRIRPVKAEGVEITYIEPDEDLGRVLEFTPERISYNKKLGYFDALREFNDLEGRKYYLEAESNNAGEELTDDSFLELFMKIPEEDVREAAEFAGCEEKHWRRTLFEELIPLLTDELEIEEKADYRRIAILSLEELARELKIERFEVYSIFEFWELIAENYEPGLAGSRRKLPEIIRKSDFLASRLRKNPGLKLTAILFASLLKRENFSPAGKQ